jgi:hypothetical protein
MSEEWRIQDPRFLHLGPITAVKGARAGWSPHVVMPCIIGGKGRGERIRRKWERVGSIDFYRSFYVNCWMME